MPQIVAISDEFQIQPTLYWKQEIVVPTDIDDPILYLLYWNYKTVAPVDEPRLIWVTGSPGTNSFDNLVTRNYPATYPMNTFLGITYNSSPLTGTNFSLAPGATGTIFWGDGNWTIGYGMCLWVSRKWLNSRYPGDILVLSDSPTMYDGTGGGAVLTQPESIIIGLIVVSGIYPWQEIYYDTGETDLWTGQFDAKVGGGSTFKGTFRFFTQEVTKTGVNNIDLVNTHIKVKAPGYSQPLDFMDVLSLPEMGKYKVETNF